MTGSAVVTTRLSRTTMKSAKELMAKVHTTVRRCISASRGASLNGRLVASRPGGLPHTGASLVPVPSLELDQLDARGDPELAEDLREVVFDRLRAHEELRRDLAVGRAAAD